MGNPFGLWGLQAQRTVGGTSEACPGGVPELQTSAVRSVVPVLPEGGPGPATVPLTSDLVSEEVRLALLLTLFSTSCLGRQDTETACFPG